MKQLLVAFIIVLLMPLTTDAQEKREIIPVDWKEIKSVADKEPQRIKNLVSRLSANENDSTLTMKERVLAYFGQSYLTPKTELAEGMELDKLLRDKKYEECLAGAKELLKKNPVSLKALSNAVYAAFNLFRDSTKHDVISRDETRVYYLRMHKILDTIAHTGEGTEEQPFYVTAVSDEYLFMRHYLEIEKRKKQYMTGKFDVFELEETSQYYSRPTLYFDITRVLEIERGLFE